MSELILHHYANSPFSEKVRLIFGLKGLAWRSVNIPPIMPKPDVVALTGGYRKTPILQIGADIYCDTALMARVLDARQPAPSLYPASAPLAPALAHWADSHLFWCAVTWAMQPAGAAVLLGATDPARAAPVMKAFAADRASFSAGMRRMTLADGTAQLRGHLAMLEAQLMAQTAAQSAASSASQTAAQTAATNGPWLMGADISIADFSVGHALWFIRRAGPMAALLTPYAAVGQWLDRLLAIGHGQHSPLASADAVALAAAATGHAATTVQAGLGFEAGQAVQVAATDYGSDPVAGSLVGLTPDEVVLCRQDPRAGVVHVHFPRQGFQIKAADPG